MKILNLSLSDQIVQQLEFLKNREGVSSNSEMIRFLIKFSYYFPPAKKSIDDQIDEVVHSIEDKLSSEDVKQFPTLKQTLEDA